MFSWLKRHLIPHGANAHRPYLLHGEGAQKVVLLVLAFELFVFFLPTLSFYDRAKEKLAVVLPAVLSSLTNEVRQEQSLSVLAVNPKLAQAAQLKAEDMATKGYFAHTSPEGRTPWYWLGQVGYEYQYAGENLAINFSDSKDVTEAWMNSPGHRANIVKGAYTQVGTGVATGIYQGRETVFVAQVYASPRLPSTTPSPTVSIPLKETVFASATPETITQESSAVLGVADDMQEAVVPEVSLTEAAAASPARTTNTILLVIAGVVFLVVVLTVVIKINTQHPDLITNGMAVIAIIGGIIIGNNFIAAKDLQTSQLDYSFVLEEKNNTW